MKKLFIAFIVIVLQAGCVGGGPAPDAAETPASADQTQQSQESAGRSMPPMSASGAAGSPSVLSGGSAAGIAATPSASASSAPQPIERDGTIEPIAGQSFDTEWEAWGRVRFESAVWTRPGGHRELLLRLLDGDGRTLYAFPLPDWAFTRELDRLQAISFKDVNGDGLGDVIVIADYYPPESSFSRIFPTTPLLYLAAAGRDFQLASETSWDLSGLEEAKTVGGILNVLKEADRQDMLAKDQWADSLCKRVRASAPEETEVVAAYTEEYNKREAVREEAGEDRMYWDLGGCFAQDTHQRLMAESGLQAHADAVYDAIGDIIGSWAAAGYISTGGGTMWSHMASRTYSMGAYHINRYIQLKRQGPKPAPASYAGLKQTLADSIQAWSQNDLAEADWFPSKEALEKAQEDYPAAVKEWDKSIQKLLLLLPDQDEASVYLLRQVAGLDMR